MKKIYSLVLLLLSVIVLVSCKNKEDLNILIPSGIPQISQMYVENDKEKLNVNNEYAVGSESLSSAFMSSSYDFIYAPINLGANLYKKCAGYKLCATISNCNFYFVYRKGSFTTNTINNLEFLDKVVFSTASFSGYLSRYILSNNGIDTTEIRYVNSVNDSMNEFLLDDSIACLLSEPALTNLEKRYTDLYIISLKDEYSKLTNTSFIPQAGIFVKDGTDKKTISKYLDKVKDSTIKVNDDILGSATLGSELFSNYTEDLLKSSIVRMGIEYNDAYSVKTDINNILNNLGVSVEDGFYYQG